MCVCVCVCVCVCDKKGKEKKKDYSTQSSQVVSNPSTNRARRGLTSLIGREVVLSSWYGRNQYYFLLFYFLLHSPTKRKSCAHTLTLSLSFPPFPFLCASVVFNLKIAFFRRWKGENSRENKKSTKEDVGTNKAQHSDTQWANERSDKQADTRTDTCACVHTAYKGHTEKKDDVFPTKSFGFGQNIWF